ncbi:MAG: class I SAM-dependent methyltransferase [Defluviitaleaceae bacterium]|nr:class I SAM-dependent methyltransferase [Defluviitaleaceae bacterium]
MRKPEKSIVSKLYKQGILQDTSILCVCAGDAEQRLFGELGIKNVTLSNISELSITNPTYKFSKQNAMNLTFENESFDYVFVSNGLHHCSSPHRALLEMYRVAKKGIVVIENKDSLLMRIAIKLNLTVNYEGIEEITKQGWGGYNNSCIPNYIYRWTEREFKKTICSYYPIGHHDFRFFYGLDIPERTNGLIATIIKVAMFIFPKSKNVFCATITKPEVSGSIFPWIKNIPNYKDIINDFHTQ